MRHDFTKSSDDCPKCKQLRDEEGVPNELLVNLHSVKRKN